MSAAPGRGVGILFCVLSAFGYGFLGVFGVRILGAGASLQTMIGWRFGLAALGLWVIVLLRRARQPRSTVFHGRTALGRRAVLQPLLLGAVIYSVQTSLYFLAVQKLNVGLAALLLYTMPAIVVIIAMLTRTERARPSLFLAVGLAIGGVALTMLGPDSAAGSLLGVLCGLGSAVAYTAYYYGMAAMPEQADPLMSSALVCTGACLSQVVLGGALGTLDLTPSGEQLRWLIPMAIVCTVVAVSLLMIGISIAGPAVASVVSCVEPITSVLLGVLIVGDAFGPMQLVGTVAVALAVVFLGIFRDHPIDETPIEHG